MRRWRKTVKATDVLVFPPAPIRAYELLSETNDFMDQFVAPETGSPLGGKQLARYVGHKKRLDPPQIGLRLFRRGFLS